jgi:hypothetical protein
MIGSVSWHVMDVDESGECGMPSAGERGATPSSLDRLLPDAPRAAGNVAHSERYRERIRAGLLVRCQDELIGLPVARQRRAFIAIPVAASLRRAQVQRKRLA